MPGPGEPAHLEVVAVAVVVLQRLVVDHVNDRHHEGARLLVYARQQRLQPARVALAVAVQIEDHVARGRARPRQPRADQPLALGQPHQLDLAGEVAVDVALELALGIYTLQRDETRDHTCAGTRDTDLEVRLVAEVVHEDDLVHEVCGGPVEHGPDGADERRPRLVGEDDDDAGGGQVLLVVHALAARVPRVGHLARVGDLVADDEVEGLGLHDVLPEAGLVPAQHHGLAHLPEAGHHLGLVSRELAVERGHGLGLEQVRPAHRNPVHLCKQE